MSSTIDLPLALVTHVASRWRCRFKPTVSARHTFPGPNEYADKEAGPPDEGVAALIRPGSGLLQLVQPR